jgi:hypothetical protein
MEAKVQVADYAAKMANQLGEMCSSADLGDLAFLFKVAAAEAKVISSGAEPLASPIGTAPADSTPGIGA